MGGSASKKASTTNTTVGAQKLEVDGPKVSKTWPNPGWAETQGRRTMLSKALHPMKAPPSIPINQGILMRFNDLHPKKALSPMYSTESGMSMLSKDKHSAKAPYSILVIEFGRLMLFNELHPEKALSQMLVTESGMLMLSRELQQEKALLPMRMTESGMLRIFKELHPKKGIDPNAGH